MFSLFRKKPTFSPQAQRAIDLIEQTQGSVYVTGKAGTGKSTLLQYIRLHSKKKIIVLAPTGIAAINVHGQTIHSFFGLKPGYELEEAKQKRLSEEKKMRLRTVKVLAIDEISMVRADVLDAIDVMLQKAHETKEPFGGVQMIFFGDLYQLPPVLTSLDKMAFDQQYPSPYFFDAHAYHALEQTSLFGDRGVTAIELDTIYRQSDPEFIGLLNAVRDNALSQDGLRRLNTRVGTINHDHTKQGYVHLFTTNARAKSLNEQTLSAQGQRPVQFFAEISGQVPQSVYPNDLTITLAKQAQVMFVYNDPERRWVNGTIGTIVDIESARDEQTGEEIEIVHVETQDGDVVEVLPYTWEISKYMFKKGEFTREQIGTFKQIPLKLAWGMTIHKSQGKTFDRVVIDLGRGSFVHGQTYVALSRARSLEGIVLTRPLAHRDIIMDQRVQKFHDEMNTKV
jgi:ATP-dependent exoDNAse (exonuclease V) alpha subunit